ncbi:MAG: SRPBCC family protein [Gemmatimonadaceae bacterium]
MTMTATAAHAAVTRVSDREFQFDRIFEASRDRVWRAYIDPKLVAQWWGRGNNLVVERMEVERGGHWRYVEHAGGQAHGFEGRYREVTPMDRIVRTFEWDGMPAHVIIETTEFEDLGNSRTRIIGHSLFHTKEECEGMLNSGMESGMNESFAALDRLLAAK